MTETSSTGGAVDMAWNAMSEPIPASMTTTLLEDMSEPHPMMTFEKDDEEEDEEDGNNGNFATPVPNDSSNETFSNCTGSTDDDNSLVQENEKDEDNDSVGFLHSPSIRLSLPTTSTPTTTTINTRRFSADAAAQAQLHALTRETYTMSLRQLRQERLSWRRDKVELDHLRTVVLAASVAGGGDAAGGSGRDDDGSSDNPLSTNAQIQSLLQEKVHNEELLEACNDELDALKEHLHSLQTEYRDLKKELKRTQQELQEERSRQEELEEKQQQPPPLEDGQHDKVVEEGHHARISMSTINSASTKRRIHDLEEQIHKWEVLYFESAEMGERQIRRLEDEVEQLREELELVREEQANITNSNYNDDAIAKLEEELQEWKTRVKELEQEMHSQREQQLTSSTGLEEKWELQVLSLSKLLLTDDSEPESFADRLAALAEEMSKAEAKSPHTHHKGQTDAELSTSPEMTQTSHNEKLASVNAAISILEQEPETQIPDILQNDDSYGDEASTTTGNSDIEQYVADLEKQIESNVAENLHLKELLSQERIVAKNREDGLRKQLMEARDLLVVATNREAILNKELAQLRDDASSTENKHAMVVEDLQAQLQRAQEEVGRLQEVAQELRQKLELSRQAQMLLSESATTCTTGTSAKSSEWEKERLYLQRQIESQQQELDEAKRRIDATQRENSQLRQVKDSLMGIDREMEELIESLEPLQNELTEQTKQAKEARDEAAFLQQELVREMAKRPEFEREIKTLKDEVSRTKGQLNQVYIELKTEQATHETELGELKAESASLKESIAYYKSSLEILHEAMHDINEDMRKSSTLGAGPMDKIFKALGDENKGLRAENEKLKIEVLEIQKTMEAKSLGMQTELKTLRQKVADLETEMDALEMEASMAIQAKNALEENLQLSKNVSNNPNGKDSLLVSHQIATTLGNRNEIDQLLQEIEEVRQQASKKQEANEEKIRKLEVQLKRERMNASLIVELKKQIETLEVNRGKATPKVSDRKDKNELQCTPTETQEFEARQLESETRSPQRLSVKDMIRSKEKPEQKTATSPKAITHDLEDQKTTVVVASKDFGTSPEDSERPLESEQLPVLHHESKQPLSVNDMIRSKQNTEQNLSTFSKTVTHDLKDQRAKVVAKGVGMSRNDSGKHSVHVETAASSLPQQGCEFPYKHRLNVKDIIRSNNCKESSEENKATSSKVRREEPQRPRISVREMLQNFEK